MQVRWQFSVVGIYTFFLLAMAIAPSASGEARAQTSCSAALQDYRVALRSYEDGLLDPAMAGFEAYLQKCPEAEQGPQAHYILGEILYKRSRFTEALHHATQVLSSPGGTALHPHAALLAGQCFLQLQQSDKAQTSLQRARGASSPPEVRAAALYWLGEIAVQQQRYDAARTYYTLLLKEQQTGTYAAYAQYSLGWLLRQRGENSAALEAFSAFLALAPNHEFASQARFVQAVLLREAGRLPEAAAAFQQLAPQAPTALQDEVLFWWAETVYQQGHYEEAQALYQRLVTNHAQSPRVNASLYGWGWAAAQQHQCAAAVQPWELLLQRDPQWPQALEVHYQLGVCYLHLTQYVAAQRHLQQVVEAGDTATHYHDALLQVATVAFRQGEYATAVRYYTRALTTASQDDRYRIHSLLGESYAALGEFAAAMEHWQQILSGPSTHPLRAPTLYRIGSEYIRQKAWSQAIPVLLQVWTEFPEFPQRPMVAQQLVQAYTQTHQCADALPFYDTLLSSTVDLWQQQAFLATKAFCLFELERYADVVQLLSPLWAMPAPAPVEPQVLYTLGQAYMRLQRYDEALGPLAALHQRFPTDPFAIAAAPTYAVVLEHAGHRRDALRVWKAYLQRSTGQGEDELTRLQLHAGRLAFQEGQYNEVLDFLAPARQALSAALAAEALFWSGEAYLQQQQWELALQVYQELIDRYQTEKHWSTLARLRIGVIYEQQHEWERALQTYQTLLTTTTDAETLTEVQQRIAAIEAGRVLKPQTPSTPSEG
jgi:tetratricopeptide (TPR) repeat protein